MNIGIIRCEKNGDRCPLTGCIKSLEKRNEGFSNYDETELTGIFTCKCPGDKVVDFGKILKSKGAEAIHFCTCTFSRKVDGKWVLGDGFCDHVDELAGNVAKETGLPCVKGTAHLPEGYQPVVF